MWIPLTNGTSVNLDLIECCVPVPGAPHTWRFFHPRTQRGGRPYGRPPDRPQSYDDDRGCWQGIPVNEAALLLAIGLCYDPPANTPPTPGVQPL